MKKIEDYGVFTRIAMDEEIEESTFLFVCEWSTASKRLFKDVKDKVDYMVDIEKAPDIAKLMDIRAVPTMVLIRNGDIVKTQAGYDKDAYDKLFELGSSYDD